MTDLGQYQTGQFVPVAVQCVDAADTPVAPASSPLLSLYGPDGVVIERLPMAAGLPGEQTGLFHKGLRLGPDMTPSGLYTVHVTWVADSVIKAKAFGFRIVDGGDEDGAVVALHYQRRPEADYLIRVTESGLVARGRNPR